MNDKTQLLICKIIIFIALVNFVSFFGFSIYFGGDAGNGIVKSGQYFLGSHGKYIQASEAVFTFSKWHAYSVWVTHSLGFLAFFWSISTKDRVRAQLINQGDRRV